MTIFKVQRRAKSGTAWLAFYQTESYDEAERFAMKNLEIEREVRIVRVDTTVVEHLEKI